MSGDALPGRDIVHLRFDRQVWYNPAIRQAAVAQIRAAGPGAPVVLVGFSKSGLGAVAMMASHPELFSGCVVFDAPVCRRALPPASWGAGAFYASVGQWRSDLPIEDPARIAAASRRVRLVLVTGSRFGDDMLDLHAAILREGGRAVLLDLRLEHRWDAGWLDPALAALG